MLIVLLLAGMTRQRPLAHRADVADGDGGDGGDGVDLSRNGCSVFLWLRQLARPGEVVEQTFRSGVPAGQHAPRLRLRLLVRRRRMAEEMWLAGRRLLAAVGEEGEFGNEGGAEWVVGALINVAGTDAGRTSKLRQCFDGMAQQVGLCGH